MSLLSQIVEAARREAARLTTSQVQAASEMPDPDFSGMPDDQIDVWIRRYKLIELSRRLREDNVMSSLRKTYANRIFLLTIFWLAAVVAMVIATGISIPERGDLWYGLRRIKFQLPEAVLVAFIGTTTVNVIALFLAVTAWLFPKDSGVHVDPGK